MGKKRRKNKGKKRTSSKNAPNENTSNENTPSENTPNESTPNENISTGNTSDENEPKENEPDEKTSDESTSNRKDPLKIQEYLALVNDKIAELSIEEYLKKPQPNGFNNRWNLTLKWGFCAAEFCLERDGLLVCNDCKAAAYCCRDHQIKDYPLHKGYCSPVRDALKLLAEEEEKLRAHPGDEHLPANPFETVRGRFSSYDATSPYLDQRCRVLSSLTDICDGRDQDAYDFTKWYILPYQEGFEWSNFSGQFLSYDDEDVLESANIFLDNPILLSNLIGITQLKLRLLLDIRMLEREAKKHGSPASYETKMEWVRKNAVSDILYRRRDIVERDDWSGIKKSLSAQLAQLYERVKKRNSHYWLFLKDAEKFITDIPVDEFEPGSTEEVAVLYTLTWRSWFECPPALTAMRVFAALCADR
ncbi:uncharacterized protein F4817DRAFT_368360 [Daldinia loculata]|uniref:uncharacterized protein n=1 Tax=Daldinia loculata TaxID=103429 RepID=UPI0020C40778|nr:uncharacterized protein F4817DRAFT_368360 [Daldinia loculata]KAI1643522.1 hypothetical protein F4817DRAFT_368360 [Daldinia loculata]